MNPKQLFFVGMVTLMASLLALYTTDVVIPFIKVNDYRLLDVFLVIAAWSGFFFGTKRIWRDVN